MNNSVQRGQNEKLLKTIIPVTQILETRTTDCVLKVMLKSSSVTSVTYFLGMLSRIRHLNEFT